MESYAQHFNLDKDIVFSANLKRIIRNEDDTKWRLELDIEGKPEVREFDKVAFTHGHKTKAKMPKFEGQENFEGTIIHAQQYRS
jgi:dimethylaniline monooxygenase (N-oxide forming)